MRSFEVPANLSRNAHRNDADFDAWFAALPATVADLAQRWSLRLEPPFQPGGECSWVAPARGPSGEQLVLKVGWRHIEALDEAAGLAAWAGDGVALLHAAEQFDATSALLLERCIPGTTLREIPEPDQDIVVTALLLRLWQTPSAVHPLRPLKQMCDQWADSFETKAARPGTMLDDGLARAASHLLRTLPANADRSALLVTDLHAGNILRAQREPWLVIDPKPYVGDPTYDALQHMLNCEERLVADPVGLAHRLADLLELDRARLVSWLFARCAQESMDRPVLAEVATRLAPP